MPCYNGEKNIEEAIGSFLEQVYDNKELIIVDGKSTDRSHDIIKSYLSKYDNIKWVKENDINVTDALNIGIKASDADFIGFLMTDDHYIYPNFFVDCAQLARYVDFDVLYSKTYYYLTANGQRWIHYWKPEQKLDRTEMFVEGSSVAIIDSTIIRRSVFDEHKLDPEYNLCSDYEFFLRIADGKTLFLYLDQFTTCCLYEGDNLSARNKAIQLQMFAKVGIRVLVDNLSEADYLLYYNMLQPEYKFTQTELKRAEEILALLLNANNATAFYNVQFFAAYVKDIWKKINTRSKGNGIKTAYQICSSPVYNNGAKTNTLLLLGKLMMRKLIHKISN
ncbi:glycosyltransferase [Mucilaginibacter sp. AW1-3]